MLGKLHPVSVVVRKPAFFWGKTAEAFAMPPIHIFSTCGVEVLQQNNQEEKTLVTGSVAGHGSGNVDVQVETTNINAHMHRGEKPKISSAYHKMYPLEKCLSASAHIKPL